MDTHTTPGFTLGDLGVSPSHNEIALGERLIKLQPKVMAVLCYLACHSQRVISKEELIEQLWAGRVVTHGSVQKSINALRGALAELLGAEEVVAHYSKRGYQLKIEPVFSAAPEPRRASPEVVDAAPLGPPTSALGAEAVGAPAIGPGRQARRTQVLLWLGLALGFFILALWGYYAQTRGYAAISKNHRVHFQSRIGYTNETGHERAPRPHPDLQHLAYIRDKWSPTDKNARDSDLMIRDGAGADWRIASSRGTWDRLAWSPSGQTLVAIEVRRQQALPLSPSFFESPKDFYTFHLFTLDLERHQIREKQIFSQWQGRIYSVSFWDETTLEFVAEQGPNSRHERYRYSSSNQQLTQLDEVPGAANPLASAILNQKTALASQQKNKINLDFLNEQQQSMGHWSLNFSSVTMSWIPDGSGVLLYAPTERKLLAFYRDGQQLEIPLGQMEDKVFSDPIFSADGAHIYYTEEHRSANIEQLGFDGVKTQVTQNANLNDSASFSPNGEKIVYASVRNNQTHLWLVQGGQERQLTSQPLAHGLGAIIWSENGEQLYFTSGANLYAYDLALAQTELLLASSEPLVPLAYFAEDQELLALQKTGETNNLWRINLRTKQRQQLSFGALGSAIAHQGDVYVQYLGEKGLWVLHRGQDGLEPVNAQLDANTKLLSVDAHGLYFIEGGICRESDVYYWNFNTAQKTTALVRSDPNLLTMAVHGRQGVLQAACYLAESNIMILQ